MQIFLTASFEYFLGFFKGKKMECIGPHCFERGGLYTFTKERLFKNCCSVCNFCCQWPTPWIRVDSNSYERRAARGPFRIYSKVWEPSPLLCLEWYCPCLGKFILATPSDAVDKKDASETFDNDVSDNDGASGWPLVHRWVSFRALCLTRRSLCDIPGWALICGALQNFAIE